MTDSALTTAEVAAFFGVSPDTIEAMYYAGLIPGIECGRTLRFSRRSLERWLRAIVDEFPRSPTVLPTPSLSSPVGDHSFDSGRGPQSVVGTGGQQTGISGDSSASGATDGLGNRRHGQSQPTSPDPQRGLRARDASRAVAKRAYPLTDGNTVDRSTKGDLAGSGEPSWRAHACQDGETLDPGNADKAVSSSDGSQPSPTDPLPPAGEPTALPAQMPGLTTHSRRQGEPGTEVTDAVAKEQADNTEVRA